MAFRSMDFSAANRASTSDCSPRSSKEANWASSDEAESSCWPRTVASWRRMLSSYRPIARSGRRRPGT